MDQIGVPEEYKLHSEHGESLKTKIPTYHYDTAGWLLLNYQHPLCNNPEERRPQLNFHENPSYDLTNGTMSQAG